MASFGTGFGAGAMATVNPNKDMEVPSTPSDGISSLKFSPTSNLLVASSWSGQVLCWDVQSNGQAIPKAAITLDKPVLCSAWSADGTTVFAGAQRPGWLAQTAWGVRRVWVGARRTRQAAPGCYARCSRPSVPRRSRHPPPPLLLPLCACPLPQAAATTA